MSVKLSISEDFQEDFNHLTRELFNVENKIKELQSSSKLKRSLVNELDQSVKTCENLVSNCNLH
jgi:hypothetical protein